MATEVNQNFFAWSQEETSVQDLSQGTSQMFGHGSISFGRFDLESLDWEKWSVFTNDRRHEEFGKFNGLVAKKKAYFEEYFKRIRELKALQQQNQQTELHLEYCGDGSDSSQTGEYEPAAVHGAPTESETLVDDSTEQTAAATTFEHGTECYGYHENGSSVNKISASTHSSPVGDLQQIGKQMRGSVSGKQDILLQDANSSQDDPMVHEIMISPNKRAIEKDSRSRVGQASKIIPKTVKMTYSNVSDHTNVSKGPCSGEPSVINQMAKAENILSLRRQREATSDLVGTAARSGITGLKSSAALQRPSTRERRPVTKDASRKPAEVTTPCRPSTSERRTVTRESALKHENNAIPCRPSTAHRRPVTKESATKQCSIATPRRPSTADRRPVTKESATKQCSIATPRRPSTAGRRPVTKESATKQCSIATPRRPSTADRHPVTKDLTPKLSNIAAPHRPSTAHRRPISKESAPKHFNVASPHRPTGERHTSSRDMASKHVGIATSYLPSAVKQCPITGEGAHKHADDVFTLSCSSTADRRPIRDVAPKHATLVVPRRPSTAERRPIARDVAPKNGLSLRPSTAERSPIARNIEPKHAPAQTLCTAERRPVTGVTVLKQANVVKSRLPLTPDRCLTKKGVISTPERPSTGGRCPITSGTAVWSKAMPYYSKGAMVTDVTPQKEITPRVVRSSKLENLSYSKERVELQADRKQKSSPFNLPSRKILTSNVSDDQGLEIFKKPNKEEGVPAHAYDKSNNVNVKTKAPVPPPLPPGRPYCTEKKSNVNSSPVGVRKPKASAPHWH